MNKKRNMFFIIILLLTFIFGFSYISFSYYSGVSVDSELVKTNQINNELLVVDGDNNTVILKPYEIKNLSLVIKSRNPITTSYKLFYNSTNEIDYEVISALPNKIEKGEKQIVNITIDNKSNSETIVDFNIYSNYLGREIVGHGEEIKK